MKTKIRNRVLSLLTAVVILSMFALQAFALQETEDNDDIMSADNISVNSTVYGTSIQGGDDWFKFTTSSNGYIQMEFYHDYGKTSHDVQLYTYDGTSKKELLRLYVHSSSQKDKSQKYGLPAGTYYILVDSDYDSNAQYNFKVSFSKDAPTTHAEQSTKPQTQPTATPTTKPTGTTAPTSARPSTTVSTTVKYSEPEYSVIKSEQFNDSDDTGVFKSGDFNIYITNSTVIIYSYTGSDSYVVIPSELEGKTVVGIDYNAFGGTSVETVVVPSSVCQFGENAFGQDDGEIIKIICEPGSYAEQYAQQNGIDFELSNDSENPENDNNTVEAYEETAGLTSGIDQNTTLVIISVAAGVVILTLVTVIIIQNKKKSNQ